MKKSTKNKLSVIANGSLKSMLTLVPVFFLAILASAVAEAMIPDSVIQSILGKNLYFSILVSTLAGIILPFPQYASYPFAAFLYKSGVYIGAVFAFIAGEVFIGNLFEDYLEIKYFSFRFWIMRFFVSFVLIFAGAIVFHLLM